MRKAFKYRIYLTNGQRRILGQQLEGCRWVYNQTLATRTTAYQQGVSLSWYETKAMLPLWKETHPSLKLVHSQVLQNITQRVDLAFQAFFRRLKEGAEDPGYPRFKGFGRYDSITYPHYGNGVRLEGDRLILSKVGAVHVVLHRRVEGTIKTVTLRHSRTSKWYVSFSVEVELERLPPRSEVVGVDVDLMSLATLSNGEQIDNPWFYRKDEADLKRAQKLKDAAKNAQKWDENRHRKTALAHIHERIANRRSDFAHKRSRELVRGYQTIVFEDLAPQQMGSSKGRGMRKSIMDVAWTQFISMTISKAEEAGRSVILVNPRDTSKMCSHCGEKVEKKLSERTHTWPHCGLVMDRDRNAALNWALQTYLGVTDRDPEPLPYDEARAWEVVGSYENDVMTLTIGTDGAGLRLEVRMKPEIRAAADEELPPDHAPFDLGLLPGDADEYIITSGAFKGQRGFFTRDESGAVVGVDLAGRLFNRVPTASE